MQPIKSKNYAGLECVLESALTGTKLNVGDHVTVRGREYELTGGQAPHKPESSGKVFCSVVGIKDPIPNEFYVGVIDAIWSVTEEAADARRAELAAQIDRGLINVDEWVAKHLDLWVMLHGSNFDVTQFCARLIVESATYHKKEVRDRLRAEEARAQARQL